MNRMIQERSLPRFSRGSPNLEKAPGDKLHTVHIKQIKEQKTNREKNKENVSPYVKFVFRC